MRSALVMQRNRRDKEIAALSEDRDREIRRADGGIMMMCLISHAPIPPHSPGS